MGLARRLVLPDLGQGTNEHLSWSVDLLCSADVTRNSCREDGNSTCQAWSLRPADLAPDQGLACSDQDCHTGR
jgi:hypothetical protein